MTDQLFTLACLVSDLCPKASVQQRLLMAKCIEAYFVGRNRAPESVEVLRFELPSIVWRVFEVPVEFAHHFVPDAPTVDRKALQRARGLGVEERERIGGLPVPGDRALAAWCEQSALSGGVYRLLLRAALAIPAERRPASPEAVVDLLGVLRYWSERNESARRRAFQERDMEVLRTAEREHTVFDVLVAELWVARGNSEKS